VTTLLVCLPLAAHAGGLTFPDNGTEALGRGAAFTAKADDATAFEYNIAGFARQRGTRLLIDLNLVFAQQLFLRAGSYPDPNNAMTPWGGQPFPQVRNTGGPFAAPFAGISTDFGYFDRWTFAVGVFGPSSTGNRTYPSGVAPGYPSPSRYDFLQATPLVILPSLAVSVRLAKWLDFGLALHVVYGKLDLASTSFVDLGTRTCPNPEYQGCDAVNRIQTSGVTATASLGLMIRPLKWLAFGAHARIPYTLDTSGTVDAQPPAVLASMGPQNGSATFQTKFPAVLRLGLRFIYMKGTHEAGDFEIDATWENWSNAQGDGPKVSIPSLSIFQDITPTIVHHYKDTFSIRVGGALNPRLPAGVLSLRAGIFYDSSATNPQDTRLDFDTLDKIGFTVGLGYRYHGFTIQAAYAYMYEPDRTVTNGDIAPINPAQHGASIDSTGKPFAAVNNGTYRGQTQIVSLGVTFAWDELVGKKRIPVWASDWEERREPPKPPPPPPPPVEEVEEPAAAVDAPPAEGGGDLTFQADVVKHKKPKKKKRR
jgi:long-chain fatty acid transport protein